MKYPIFAFVIGGLFVEFVHVLSASDEMNPEKVIIGALLFVTTVISGFFEATWNFGGE